MRPFVVFSLPRSRTTWLSQFLSFGDWHCGHDELRHMRQLEDVRSWLSQPNTGTVETAGAPFWRLALHLRPDLRIVTIRRDPDEAAASAVAAGYGDDEGVMAAAFMRLERKLGQIERRTGCRSFSYYDLVHEEVCADLFSYLLPYKFDAARWARLDRKNLQTHAAALKRYVAAYGPQLDRLSAIARQKSLALLTSKPLRDVAGLTLGFEPFADFVRDCTHLFRDHCAEVGEDPEEWRRKNILGLQGLDDRGSLQVTVARINGRPFGYLLTAIGESLEAEGRLWSCHNLFYGSPEVPGLGLKLQRKAAEGLRERGVYEVAMRAGVRGAGERVSTLYRRMGAEPFGTYYRLQLQGAA